MSQLTPISHLLHKAGKKIFGKQKSRARITLPRLLELWEDIIAPDDATQILPSHITWKKLEEKVFAGTLYITAPSAIAAKIMYRERIIIERVNRTFGLPDYGRITRLSVTHASIATKKFTPPPAASTASGAISSDTEAHLAKVDDPVLREKLTSIARAMASKNLP